MGWNCKMYEFLQKKKLHNGWKLEVVKWMKSWGLTIKSWDEMAHLSILEHSKSSKALQLLGTTHEEV